MKNDIIYKGLKYIVVWILLYFLVRLSFCDLTEIDYAIIASILTLLLCVVEFMYATNNQHSVEGMSIEEPNVTKGLMDDMIEKNKDMIPKPDVNALLLGNDAKLDNVKDAVDSGAMDDASASDVLTQLSKMSEESDVSSDVSDWYDEGIQWILDELIDGEMYEIMEDNPVYAYTSLGRFANIKSKGWRTLNLQCHTIAGNMTGGAFSMTKIVKERWGIELNYDTLHKESKKWIRVRLEPKKKRK